MSARSADAATGDLGQGTQQPGPGLRLALGVPDVQAVGGVLPTGTAALYGFVINKGLGVALVGKATFTARYGR